MPDLSFIGVLEVKTDLFCPEPVAEPTHHCQPSHPPGIEPWSTRTVRVTTLSVTNPTASDENRPIKHNAYAYIRHIYNLIEMSHRIV